MHMNDLSIEIRTRLNQSDVMLIGAATDDDGGSCIGCSQKDQYIVWPEEKSKKIK